MSGSLEEMQEKLKLGGFVKIPFCSMGMDGKACSDRIKEACAGDVRGERFDVKEKASGNCIVCGKAAKSLVYAARQY